MEASEQERQSVAKTGKTKFCDKNLPIPFPYIFETMLFQKSFTSQLNEI